MKALRLGAALTKWDHIVDFLGRSVILAWLGLSAYFAWRGDGTRFQAVGVVGISAAITYFVMQRHSAPYPYGQLELALWRDKNTSQAMDTALRAHAHIGLIARDLAKESLSAGREVPPAIAAFAAVPIEHTASIISRDPEREFPLMHELSENQIRANDAVNLTRRRSEILQAIVVVLATLQSGLGSLLFAG